MLWKVQWKECCGGLVVRRCANLSKLESWDVIVSRLLVDNILDWSTCISGKCKDRK